MRDVIEFLFSSIGKKILMALTGLALCGFLMVHLMGNYLMFAGGEFFNAYSHLLTSKKMFLYTAEAGLILLFVVHMVSAAQVVLENWCARPVGYLKMKSRGEKTRKTLASRTMPYTGAIILAFMVYHIITIKYGPYYDVTYDGKPPVRDMFKVVIDSFMNPYISGLYTIVMAILAFHLYHACSSAVQTLGINHKKINLIVLWGSKLFAIAIGIGFGIIPFAFYYMGGN